MFENVKAYQKLAKEINKNLQDKLAHQIEKLMGDKELTPSDIDNLLQSGKVVMTEFRDTAPGYFGNPYRLGSSVFKIVDTVNDKSIIFSIRVNVDMATLDYEINVIDEELINY